MSVWGAGSKKTSAVNLSGFSSNPPCRTFANLTFPSSYDKLSLSSIQEERKLSDLKSEACIAANPAS